MERIFTIGDKEKHVVGVSISALTGKMTIKIDGIKTAEKHSFTGSEIFRMKVGNEEQHDVEVQISGILTSKVELFVDGKLTSVT